MTATIEHTHGAKSLSARTQRVIDGTRAVVELGRWVHGELSTPPDLSFLNERLDRNTLAQHRDTLERWADMFSESLATYQGLLEMSRTEWAKTSEKSVIRLEGMLQRAASGIALWV